VPEFSHHDIHQLQIEEVLKRLETSNRGLSFDEAQRRLARYGPNVLVEPDRYSPLRGLARHFTHFLAILLWIAAGLSFAADFMRPGEGMATLGWTILGVIMINAGFAFFQEYRAERALHALRRLLPDKAWVTREGQSVEIARRSRKSSLSLVMVSSGCRWP
jgi:sodium/potassium-transporting ATPase subunit alpha